MDILKTLEEDVTYEVLVSTTDGDNNINIRPFGIRYEDNHFILNLYPNKTLHNIKISGNFIIYFTQDSLLFTKALLSDLTVEELSGLVDCAVECGVTEFESDFIDDVYGKNVTTKIIAKANNLIEYTDRLPIISRATNNIIELLVDFSRYHFMDKDARIIFNKKLELTENIIKRTGNKKHLQSLKMLKKELKQE